MPWTWGLRACVSLVFVLYLVWGLPANGQRGGGASIPAVIPTPTTTISCPSGNPKTQQQLLAEFQSCVAQSLPEGCITPQDVQDLICSIPMVQGSPSTGQAVVWGSSPNSQYLQEASPNLVVGGSLNIASSNNSIAVTPTGNALATQSSLNVQGTTQFTNTREFLFNLGLVATTGFAGSPSTAATDKVAFYVGVQGRGNQVGNLWAENPVVWLDPTFAVPTGHHQVSELDMENSYADVLAGDGPAGMQFPYPASSGAGLFTYGLVVESVGHRNTAAIDIAGATQWYRGVGCDQTNAVAYSCLYDYSTSANILEDYGSHTNGIDLSHGTFSGNAFKSPGFSVNPGGLVQTTGGFEGPLVTWADNTPCTAGQIGWDANYIYVCTATNTVKRAALSNF